MPTSRDTTPIQQAPWPVSPTSRTQRITGRFQTRPGVSPPESRGLTGGPIAQEKGLQARPSPQSRHHLLRSRPWDPRHEVAHPLSLGLLQPGSPAGLRLGGCRGWSLLSQPHPPGGTPTSVCRMESSQPPAWDWGSRELITVLKCLFPPAPRGKEAPMMF